MLPASVVKSSAPDHHRGAVDQTRAGDDAVGGDLAADEGAELAERALVEQVVDARRGRRACPCRDAWPAAPSPPIARECSRRRSRSSSVSFQSSARSSCAIPVLGRRSSHRHVHVDHTELLTVASSAWVTAAASRSTRPFSASSTHVADAAPDAGTTRLRRLLDRRDQPRPVPAADCWPPNTPHASSWAPASRWRSRAIR